MSPSRTPFIGILFMLVACAPHQSAVTAAERAGCVGVDATYQHLAARVVLSISAVECRAGGGVVSSAEALTVLAHAAWSSPGHHIDAVYATVYSASEDPQVLRARSVEQSRAELSARWGERPGEQDAATVDQRGSGAEWAYLFILVSLGMLAVLVSLIKSVRSGRIRLMMIVPWTR